MKQDRMTIAPTHRPHPLLAAVEPKTAPDAQAHQMDEYRRRAHADRAAAMIAYVGVVTVSKPLPYGRFGLVLDTARGPLPVILTAGVTHAGDHLLNAGRMVRVTGNLRNDRGGSHLRAVDIRNAVAQPLTHFAGVSVIHYAETAPASAGLRLAARNGELVSR